MSDPRIDKLADILVGYSTRVQPGDWVLIKGHVLALPLVHATLEKVLRAGGRPTVQLYTDEMDELLARHASDEILDWLSPADEAMMEGLDVRIGIRAVSNTRSLTNFARDHKPFFGQTHPKIQRSVMQRTAAGNHRWVGTQFPCPAYAQEADMSLSEYEDFVYGATFADTDDPVANWTRVHDEQQKIVDWLDGRDRLVVKGPNIDMSLSLRGRTWINSDGKRNMPSGEVFTGPVEDSVEGWVRFSYPAIREGREVEGIELRFADGKVVEASARKNEAFLLSQLDKDPGARYLGEFALGTNYQIQKFTKSILYDEKIGGTLHMAVGAGYPETGSTNHSAVHWDMICDMREQSEITVDGELLYRDGEFVI